MKIHLNWSQILNWITPALPLEIASVCPSEWARGFPLFKVKAVMKKIITAKTRQKNLWQVSRLILLLYRSQNNSIHWTFN